MFLLKDDFYFYFSLDESQFKSEIHSVFGYFGSFEQTMEQLLSCEKFEFIASEPFRYLMPRR